MKIVNKGFFLSNKVVHGYALLQIWYSTLLCTKQIRVVKEILGLGVFHYLQCSGFFFRQSNGRKRKFSKRKLLTFMDCTSTFPQVVNMRYSKQLDSFTLK